MEMKTSLMWESLERIKEFQEGLAALQEAYPTVSLKKVREYLVTGQNTIPDRMKGEVNRLEAIRQATIKDEMFYLEAQAKEKGITIPPELVSGKCMHTVFAPEVYAISPNFTVVEFVSWFTPEETVGLMPWKFF